jgi:L-ascorbate metabolism protein UlaG (beta-lactamase superfamily)
MLEDINQIRVVLLANAGIILQYNETKILIDGLHENNEEMFSGLSKHVLDDLLMGEKPLFRNIDYILYTHCHYDHFTARCNEVFLEKHRVKGMFIPDRQTEEFISLRKTAMRQSNQIWLLDIPLGEKKEIQLLDDISVTIFRSIHAGDEYADVENFCYMLNFHGRKIFIIGDSEYNAQYFSKMLAGESIEVAFINPMFLNKHAGREVITQALKPEKLVVYHIPFEDQDKSIFRKLVPHDIKKYKNSLPPIYILWNELQEVSF